MRRPFSQMGIFIEHDIIEKVFNMGRPLEIH
jgi:hypothetical protein